MIGYTGQLLRVDLTNERLTVIPLRSDLTRFLIGGSGYACASLYELVDFTAPPLSPGNAFMFMTGPLTGTLAPCTGRHVVCARSPLTGFWGESNAGGLFGAELKFAGFDGILITGKASSPKVLWIEDGKATIENGKQLWGLDTAATQNEISQDAGRVRIACIGPAGENLVRFASIVNEERVAARCGLGAVMGSKLLKAIIVRGHRQPDNPPSDEFRNLALETIRLLRVKHKTLGDEGTAMYVDRGMYANDMPIKYFQESEFDISNLNAKALSRLLVGRKACYSCPIACGRVIELSKFGIVRIAGPEYQTIASFGTNMLNDDISDVAYANWLCNNLGMDTISCGSTIALVMDLYDKGLLDFELQWGDMPRVFEIIKDIAFRRRFGSELAEGSLRFAMKYGLQEHVLQVKGLEVPNHDPRAYTGLATTYAVASRGASHTESDMHTVDIGIEVPELGILASDRLQNEGKGETAARNQAYRAFCDSLIICHFPEVPPNVLVRFLSMATDISYSVPDVLEIGKKIVTVKRLFNMKCGLTPKDDRLPPRLMQPLEGSVIENSVPDLKQQLREYYTFLNWESSTGVPKEQSIKAILNGQHR